MAGKVKYHEFSKLDKPNGKAAIEGYTYRKRLSIAQSARAYGKVRGFAVTVKTEGGTVTITRIPNREAGQ